MLFLRLQYKLLLLLIGLCLLPMVAMNLYLPIDVPNIYIFFLTLLAGLRISFYKDKPFRMQLNKKTRSDLIRENGKPPSNNQIVARVASHIAARDMAFGVVGVLIFLVAALMGKL